MVHSQLAIYSTDDLPHKLKQLENNWEVFMSENKIPGPQNIRTEVLKSWKRCKQYNVDPLQKQSPILIDENQFVELIGKSKLYSVSQPIIENLYKQIRGTKHLITLSDSDGRIIYLKGDYEIEDQAQEMNFVIGADWSEKAAGSNAIGTSLAAGKPIQILSSEHYCQGVHPWVCSAAPIKDPLSKKIIGCIDLTGPSAIAQPHSLTVVRHLTNIIEQNLLTNSYHILEHLQQTYDELKSKNTASKIMVLDESLHVIHADHESLDLLKIAHWAQLWSHDEMLRLKNSLLDSNAHPYKWEWDVSSLGVKIFIQSIELESKRIGFVFCLEKLHQYRPADSSSEIALQGVIGNSCAMKTIIRKAKIVSNVNVPVLLTGESGTGKEVFAHGIHKQSSRKDKPFIAINCGAIPQNLITSELFGYESGAFTGGNPKGKKGKFEEADGGTLLLDEIGEMPLELQVHLLRVLQEKEIVRIGSSKPIPLDVRIIAATNKNLTRLIEDGRFRSDLYYRLNVVELQLPPLRERKSDIPLLSESFAAELAKTHQKPIPAIDWNVLQFFHRYDWPGNIRELLNVMEYAVLFNENNRITLNSLPHSILDKKEEAFSRKDKRLSTLEEKEKEHIAQLIYETNGNLSEVARRLDIARTTLYRRIKKYNLGNILE